MTTEPKDEAAEREHCEHASIVTCELSVSEAAAELMAERAAARAEGAAAEREKLDVELCVLRYDVSEWNTCTTCKGRGRVPIEASK